MIRIKNCGFWLLIEKKVGHCYCKQCDPMTSDVDKVKLQLNMKIFLLHFVKKIVIFHRRAF